MPRISVCVPTYNRAHHLPDAIESILSQTYGDFELVVSDNASTDNTAEVLDRYRDPRMGIHRNAANLGLVGNFNRCLELARTPYVILCCSDDYWAPQLLEREMGFMDQHPGVTYLHTGSIVVSTDKRAVAPNILPLDPVTPGRQYLTRFLLEDLNGTNFSSALYPTRLLRDAGGFDPRLPHTQDLAVWARMALRGDVGYIAEPLVYFRKHADNYHVRWQWPEYLKERLRLLEHVFGWREALDPNLQRFRSPILRATVERILDAFVAMRLDGVGPGALADVLFQCLRRNPGALLAGRSARATAAVLLSPSALRYMIRHWGQDNRKLRAAGGTDMRGEFPVSPGK